MLKANNVYKPDLWEDGQSQCGIVFYCTKRKQSRQEGSRGFSFLPGPQMNGVTIA